MILRTFRSILCLLVLLAGVVAAQDLTDAELQDKKFMHAGTFAGQDTGGWARDDLELEGAYFVKGVEGRRMYELLRQDPDSGQPLRGDLLSDDNVFRDLRRQSIVEAFSIGYPIDELPWDADRHRVREQNPLVWLAIEPGNFEVDERRNRRLLSLGTDLMDDIYCDTSDYLMLRHGLTLRGRKRWDSLDELRRLLIGTKAERGMNELGIKVSAKVDIRTDSASEEDILALEDMLRSGLVTWDGQPEVAAPCRELYKRLLAAGAQLPDSPTYRDVLLVEPRAFLRSIRSRYHLNEVRLTAVAELHALGASRLTALLAMAREARMDGAVPAALEPALRDWETRVATTLDLTRLVERVRPRLAALDATFDVTEDAVRALLPTAPAPATPASIDELAAREVELRRRRVVAEALSELYHEAAQGLDDGSSASLRRAITRSLDRALEPHAAWYVAWKKAQDPKAFGPLTTFDRFVELVRETLARPAAEQAADVEAYNAFGREQRAAGRRPFRDFDSLPADALTGLLRQLQNEQVRVWMRQVEAAGSASLGLWFDQARAFYIPGSRRSSGNFMIDTMDFTSMYGMDVWDGVAPKDRTARVQLDESKLLHCVLVNELQIELTSVSPYTDRLRRLGSAFGHARAFMRWVDQTQPGTAYPAALDALGALADAEREAKLGELNAFIAQSGEGAPSIAWDDLEALERALLTAEVRDAPAGQRPKALQVAYDGARFVFDEYFKMMTYVSMIKGEPILEALDDAGGPDGMTWVPIEASKGVQALTRVRDRAAPPGAPTDGLTGAITTPAPANLTKAAAATAERKVYPEARLAQGESRWFKLELGAAERAEFVARFEHDQGDVDLLLEAEDGQPLRRSQGAGDVETIRFVATTPRTVYLRVTVKDGGASGPYVLEVR